MWEQLLMNKHHYFTHDRKYYLRGVKVEPASNLASKEIKRETTDQDQDTEDLIKHAESILERAKRINEGLQTPPKRKNLDKPDVGTEVPKWRKSTDIPNVETSDKLTPPTRKIKCKLCGQKFFSVDELNSHHTMDHGVEKCTSCHKCFDSKSALQKHMSIHNDARWICDSCGKTFDYESRLLQHQRVHDNKARLYCPTINCGKSFKNVGDYNRHLKTHQVGGWFMCKHCPYKNKDKRNRDSHMRVHTAEGDKERYECLSCHKQLRFSTQVKRHRESGCEFK